MHSVSQYLDPETTKRWLSVPRYQRYLTAAGEDHNEAIDLYVWNSQVVAAGVIEVGHLEVALRNAYDRRLCRKFPEWTLDPQSELFNRVQGVAGARSKQQTLNSRSQKLIQRARYGLGAKPTHGEVVAALTFGFWNSLTARERAPIFWPQLRPIFPDGTTRARVHELTSNVVRFRNRLAHNEPVFSTFSGLTNRLDEVRQLFELVDPTVASFAKKHSKLDENIRRCPVHHLIRVP